jgi:hypothetical protein
MDARGVPVASLRLAGREAVRSGARDVSGHASPMRRAHPDARAKRGTDGDLAAIRDVPDSVSSTSIWRMERGLCVEKSVASALAHNVTDFGAQKATYPS